MTAPVEHTDVGAYALGLLEDADRDAFEAHLVDCPRCQAELDELGDMRGLFADLDADLVGAEPLRVPDSFGTLAALDGPDVPELPEAPEPPARVARFPEPTRSESGTGPGTESATESSTESGAESRTEQPPSAAPSTSAPVVDLGARRDAKTGRARRAARLLVAAAAAVALLVAGIAIGGGFSSEDGKPQVAQSPHDMPTTPSGILMMTGQRFPAEGVVQGVDGVTGAVALESKGWGSHVGLELRGVQGPLRCNLVAVGKNGDREVVGNWSVPAKGYGVPGNPDPLTFHGGTSIPVDQLQQLEVHTADGKTLVTVPV